MITQSMTLRKHIFFIIATLFFGVSVYTGENTDESAKSAKPTQAEALAFSPAQRNALEQRLVSGELTERDRDFLEILSGIEPNMARMTPLRGDYAFNIRWGAWLVAAQRLFSPDSGIRVDGVETILSRRMVVFVPGLRVQDVGINVRLAREFPVTLASLSSATRQPSGVAWVEAVSSHSATQGAEVDNVESAVLTSFLAQRETMGLRRHQYENGRRLPVAGFVGRFPLPTVDDVYFSAGEAGLALGNLIFAEEAWERLSETSGRTSVAWGRLARALDAAGNADGAEFWWNRLRETFPDTAEGRAAAQRQPPRVVPLPPPIDEVDVF